jgi:hypothetical protein
MNDTLQNIACYSTTTPTVTPNRSSDGTPTHGITTTPLNETRLAVINTTPTGPPLNCPIRGDWPVRYTLPVLTRKLQEALDQQSDIILNDGKSGLRSTLMQILFEDVSQYTL